MNTEQARTTLQQSEAALERARCRASELSAAAAEAEAQYVEAQSDEVWRAFEVAKSAKERAAMDVAIAEKALASAEETMRQAELSDLLTQFNDAKARANIARVAGDWLGRLETLYSQLGELDHEFGEITAAARKAHAEANQLQSEIRQRGGGASLGPFLDGRSLPRALARSLLSKRVAADERYHLIPRGGLTEAQQEFEAMHSFGQ